MLYKLQMIGHEEWNESRTGNLKHKGMSSGYRLTTKDCKIRMRADLDETGGKVSRIFATLTIFATMCSIVSLVSVFVYIAIKQKQHEYNIYITNYYFSSLPFCTSLLYIKTVRYRRVFCCAIRFC